MIRYAYRAEEARSMKAAMEALGLQATISVVDTRGNHGRAGYHNVRGSLVAKPSYKITGVGAPVTPLPDGMVRCTGCGRPVPADLANVNDQGTWCHRCG